MSEHNVTYRIVQYGDKWRATILVDGFVLEQEKFYHYHEAESWCRLHINSLHTALA